MMTFTACDRTFYRPPVWTQSRLPKMCKSLRLLSGMVAVLAAVWIAPLTSLAVPEGLLLHYSFDSDQGGVVPDHSGNGKAGAVSGAIWTSQGVSGGAYRFDGVDDCISFPDSGLPASNAARTVSIWVKVESFKNGPANYAFSYGITEPGHVFSLDLGSSSHNFRIVDWPDCGDTGYKPPIGTWQHIAVTHDGAAVSLYVNGAFVWSRAHVFSTALSSFGALAAWKPTPNEYPYNFNGSIDEVMIFNRALSANEIAALHNSQTSAPATYDLNTEVSGCGSVDVGDGPQIAGSQVTIAATAESGNHFVSWSGDVPSGHDNDNPLTVTMDQARTTTANFAVDGLPSGLALYYSFDGDHGLVVPDESGSGNAGALNGATWTAVGKVGGAYVFDGVNDIIDMGPGKFDTLTNCTFSMWLNSPQPVANDLIIFEHRVNDAREMDLRVDGNGMAMYITDGGGTKTLHTPTYAFNSWVHIVAVYGNGGMALYYNGQMVGSSAVFTNTLARLGVSAHNKIGMTDFTGPHIGGGCFYQGALDEFMIFNRALSAEEVAALYAGQDGTPATYDLDTGVSGCGSVDVGDGPQTAGSQVTITATAESGSHFVNWSGDVPSGHANDNPLTVTMDQARAITANFAGDGLPDGLILHYSFDSDQGAIVPDESGSGNAGALSGATWIADGKVGGAYIFDGANDFIDVGPAKFDTLTNATFSMWLNTPQPVANDLIVFEHRVNDACGISLRVDGNSVAFHLSDGTGASHEPGLHTQTCAFNSWVHIVTVLGNDGMRLYHNGQLVSSADAPATLADLGISLDNKVGMTDYTLPHIGGGCFYQGALDEFMIFNRALSAEEIAALYNGQTGTPATYDLDTGVSSHGSVDVGDGSYAAGSQVTITATAATGYRFVSWSGDVPSGHANDNPLTVTMDRARTLTANFVVDGLPSGLALYYSFDGDHGATVPDDSGSGNAGVVSGATWTASGKVGGACIFDGSNDYIDIIASNKFDALTNVTLGVWINCPQPVAHDFIMFEHYANNSNRQDLRVAGSSVGSDVVKNGGQASLSTPTFSFGNWVHVVAVYGNGGMALYYNGQLATNNTACTNSFANLGVSAHNTIGKTDFTGPHIGGGCFFQGALDEFMIFNRALSADEIAALYGGHIEPPVLRTISISGNPAEYGTATPYDYGTHSVAQGTVVTCTVPAVVEVSGVRHVCTGWAGTGDVSAGSGNSTVFTIATDSTLSWQWETSYYLNVGTDGNGSVNVDDGWMAAGSVVAITATPADGYQFTGWSGDVSSTENPLAITMDRNLTVTACFAAIPPDDSSFTNGSWLVFQRPSGPADVWVMDANMAVVSSANICTSVTPWEVRGLCDLDGDGTADVFWQHPAGPAVCWFMNADGTVRATTSIYTSNTTWRICGAGDLDQDGVADLFWQLPSGKAACWFMNADGTVQSTVDICTDNTPWQICGVADLDRDGTVDLFWHKPSGQVACWLMNADGTCKSTMDIYSATTPWQLRCVGDLDKDGVPDLFWQLPAGQVTTWLMNSDGTVKSMVRVVAAPSSWRVVAFSPSPAGSSGDETSLDNPEASLGTPSKAPADRPQKNPASRDKKSYTPNDPRNPRDSSKPVDYRRKSDEPPKDEGKPDADSGDKKRKDEPKKIR